MKNKGKFLQKKFFMIFAFYCMQNISVAGVIHQPEARAGAGAGVIRQPEAGVMKKGEKGPIFYIPRK